MTILLIWLYITVFNSLIIAQIGYLHIASVKMYDYLMFVNGQTETNNRSLLLVLKGSEC